MSTGILPASLALPRPTNRALSSIRSLTSPEQLEMRTLSLGSHVTGFNLMIRMGGGPRTFPGGVSKWQWKRMQAKKAKQLLKARLCRERQLYEMRKRAELKTAIAELERPWEVVEKAPTLFSVGADEQVKALADRFQRAGGFDMWSESDGPQVFRTADGLPSARFFPKGVVHSVKPYGIVANRSESEKGDGSEGDGSEELRFDDWIARGAGGTSRRRSRGQASSGHGGRGDLDVRRTRYSRDGVNDEGDEMEGQSAREEGVRRNAYERRDAKDSSSQFNSRSRVGDGQRYGSSGRFCSDLDEKSGGGRREIGKTTGRERYAGSNRRVEGEKISTSGLYLEEGQYHQHGSHDRFGSGNSDVEKGKLSGRGRYAGSNRRVKSEKISEGSYQRYGLHDRFGSNVDEMTGNSEVEKRKMSGRGRYAGSNRRIAEKVSLRPTTDLYLEQGSYGMRVSKSQGRS